MKASLELEVLNERGLHARPAAAFVKCALRYKGTAVRLIKDGQSFAAASILEVLTAELGHAARFTVEADGPDADAAVREFAGLMEQFREEEEAEGKGPKPKVQGPRKHQEPRFMADGGSTGQAASQLPAP